MSKQEIKEVLDRKVGYYTKYLAMSGHQRTPLEIVGDWVVKVYQYQVAGFIESIDVMVYKGEKQVRKFNQMYAYKQYNRCVREIANMIDKDVNARP